jgi:hypothetical protein
MKKIYFVLTDTGTLLNRTIKIYTKEPYNHASIAFDENLKELYSFGRLKYNNPFIAGFVKEDINNPLLRNANTSIYSFDVTEKQYNELLSNIETFKVNKNKYQYNLIGLLSFLLNRPIKRDHKYFCSQFVSEILSKSNLNLIDKDPSLTKPSDFSKIDKVKHIFTGVLKDYN